MAQSGDLKIKERCVHVTSPGGASSPSTQKPPQPTRPGPDRQCAGARRVCSAGLDGDALLELFLSAHLGPWQYSLNMRASSGMSALRTIVVVAAVVVLVLVIFAPLRSPYLRLIHKDRAYYERLARGCDTLLVQHPLGTNSTLDVAASDPSLPKVISDLHPTQIMVSTNGVWFMKDRDFGVGWRPQDQDTNQWALTVFGEGPFKVVYVEARK